MNDAPKHQVRPREIPLGGMARERVTNYLSSLLKRVRDNISAGTPVVSPTKDIPEVVDSSVGGPNDRGYAEGSDLERSHGGMELVVHKGSLDKDAQEVLAQASNAREQLGNSFRDAYQMVIGSQADVGMPISSIKDDLRAYIQGEQREDQLDKLEVIESFYNYFSRVAEHAESGRLFPVETAASDKQDFEDFFNDVKRLKEYLAHIALLNKALSVDEIKESAEEQGKDFLKAHQGLEARFRSADNSVYWNVHYFEYNPYKRAFMGLANSGDASERRVGLWKDNALVWPEKNSKEYTQWEEIVRKKMNRVSDGEIVDKKKDRAQAEERSKEAALLQESMRLDYQQGLRLVSRLDRKILAEESKWSPEDRDRYIRLRGKTVRQIPRDDSIIGSLLTKPQIVSEEEESFLEKGELAIHQGKIERGERALRNHFGDEIFNGVRDKTDKGDFDEAMWQWGARKATAVERRGVFGLRGNAYTQEEPIRMVLEALALAKKGEDDVGARQKEIEKGERQLSAELRKAGVSETLDHIRTVGEAAAEFGPEEYKVAMRILGRVGSTFQDPDIVGDREFNAYKKVATYIDAYVLPTTIERTQKRGREVLGAVLSTIKHSHIKTVKDLEGKAGDGANDPFTQANVQNALRVFGAKGSGYERPLLIASKKKDEGAYNTEYEAVDRVKKYVEGLRKEARVAAAVKKGEEVMRKKSPDELSHIQTVFRDDASRKVVRDGLTGPQIYDLYMQYQAIKDKAVSYRGLGGKENVAIDEVEGMLRQLEEQDAVRERHVGYSEQLKDAWFGYATNLLGPKRIDTLTAAIDSGEITPDEFYTYMCLVGQHESMTLPVTVLGGIRYDFDKVAKCLV